jgi:hypothetical protein
MSDIVQRTTLDRFHLNCKVVSKRIAYREHQSKGKEWNESAEVILLLPQQSTEADCFYSAWLPEKLTEAEIAQTKEYKPYSELVMETGYPINGYFRGAVEWGNHLIPQPHIFVMTREAEEKLRPMIGKTIRIDTLGDGEEESRYELRAETDAHTRRLE